MKKIISIIFILMIFMGVILIPNNTYAYCNTIRFTKDVSAVQLILADGQVLYDLEIERKATASTTGLISSNFKNLNMIFVMETENGVSENKESINNFIDKIYELYSTSSDKVQMGIVPFEDLNDTEISSRTSTPNVNENILKNSQSDIKNEVYNLNVNSNQTLEEALKIVAYNLEMNDDANNNKNEEIQQIVILLTDGIENQTIKDNSNVVLRALSENMVTMYGILIESYQSQYDPLLNDIIEMKIVDGISLSNVEYQLENDVFTYINEYVVKRDTLVPKASNSGALLTSDVIVLTADEEEHVVNCAKLLEPDYLIEKKLFLVGENYLRN